MTRSKKRTPTISEAPDDAIVYGMAGLEATILAANPVELVENALQSDARKVEQSLARMGKGRGRAQRDRERLAIRSEMRAAGLPNEAVYVASLNAFRQVLLRERKDLNQLVADLAGKLPGPKGIRAASRQVEQQLETLLQTPSLLLNKRLQGKLAAVGQELRLAANATVTKRELRQCIEEAYDTSPGTAWNSRESDLDYLMSRFWQQGRFQMLKRAPRRPLSAPWPTILVTTAEALCAYGVSVNKSAHFISRLFSLELIETGLIPSKFGPTFRSGAIKTELYRRRRRSSENEDLS